jgi:hypothetical protein
MVKKITDQRLNSLKDGNALREYVIDYIKDGYQPQERAYFISDVLKSGCVSGVVRKLIYYTDTHAFFDRFYGEIEELRQEWEENTGEAIKIKNDLKNDLAWFGFEETIYWLANELDLDW